MIFNIHSLSVKKMLTQTIIHFGTNAQKYKAEEELTELLLEIKRDLSGRKNNVEEELADVLIMTEQLKQMYDINKIDYWVKYKLERLKGVIEKDGEELQSSIKSIEKNLQLLLSKDSES